MDRAEIEDILKETVNGCANSEGWANLAEIGTALRKREIKYGKLSRFISGYSNIIETSNIRESWQFETTE